jgi:ArsR family transcriptional regulator, lead/cadmium/zinc/bismuth-responsive transcriptional repressor
VNQRTKPSERRSHSHRHSRRSPTPKLPHTAFVRAAALFRAAGDVARLRLLHTLAHGEWCVSELATDAGTKLSTLSQQLRVLYSERIVERRRDGKHVYYRLADDHVRDLVAAALDHASER